jgi:methylglutaconyl-CoA hydratase
MNLKHEYSTISLSHQGPVCIITLNRPEVHNALNNTLIYELYDAFNNLKEANDIRVIVLTGNGQSFCAGADLKWLKDVMNYSFDQNYEESLKLAELMLLIYTHPKPTIARINGSAIGGGVGLMSVCDILISTDTAMFGLSEVKIGLVPAVISPFVIARIGIASTRELFITGERIKAHRALEIGLVNTVSPNHEIDKYVNGFIQQILANGPEAVKTVKELIFKVPQMNFPEVTEYTAELIAKLRISPEGQEGMSAFLEKRPPSWITKK